MIAVDTSALAAVVFGEPDAESYLETMQAEPAIIGTATFVEASIVVEARRGADASHDLQLLIAGAIDEVVPLDSDHASIAFEAWRRFGKGRHPASLNFGDCLAYASARARDLPLLFKGEDFPKTDILAAQLR